MQQEHQPEYIERQPLLGRLQVMIDEINYSGIEDRRKLLAKERALESAKSIVLYAPDVDAVPWTWLQSYAEGKRCNYASDFIIEAMEEWKSEETNNT